MDGKIRPGKYVVAVSGGVDSMVLLDMLAKKPQLQLVVAHYDHGIRTDSGADREFVAQAASTYGLPFIYEAGYLGARTSEAAARNARYAFLRRVMQEQQAAAIITAHHQDDLIETAILNILRGTGRKGLTSLATSDDVVRPLLELSKQEILDYAANHHISWREDSTNQTDTYARNYVRHHIMPRLGERGRTLLRAYINRAQALNPEIDTILDTALGRETQGTALNRYWFTMLPYVVSCEAMAAWLRRNGIREFDRPAIERLVIAAKVGRPGKKADINAVYLLKVGKTEVQISRR